MKEFRKNKSFDEIERKLISLGFKKNYKDFKCGGDYRFFEYGQILGKKIRRIAYGNFGNFMVFSNGQCIASHLSESLDNTPWYSDLLDILYETKKNTEVSHA